MSSDGPLYSAQWHRVASLQPRLQPGVRIRRQVLRGREWFVFTHPVSGRHYRLNRKAYELAGRLDGEHTLDALWQGLQQRLGDELPGQDEIIAMLAHLMEAGLVLFDTLPDWSAIRQQQRTREARERQAALNPFAFRLKLFEPRALLDRLAPLQAALWHPLIGILCALLAAWALLNVALDWNAIHAYASVHLLTPRCLLLAWLAYPLMKALHELAHALAVRHWGGEVSEAGVSFFFLVPAPYVDASAATAFPRKQQRAAVSCAGIAVELLLAALAFAVWRAAADGVVRDLAFAVMAIGGLSTLVFNANPLMRFDGYYILCDLLELPNLATRSQRWWTQRLQDLLHRSDQDGGEQTRGSEGLWLFLYAPASWLYRMLVSVVIVQWIAAKSLPLAAAAALWLAFSLLVAPLWSLMRLLFAPGHPGAGHWKPLTATAAALVALILFVCAVPLPSSTVADGVVWLPEHSQLRTDSDARLMRVVAGDGQRVARGQALIVMEEPTLLARKAGLLARIAAAQTEQASGWIRESVQGRNAQEELARLQQELDETDDRLDRLTLRAEVDGVFVFPHAEDMLGRDIPKGTLLAYVLTDEAAVVRAAIPHDDIGRFRGGVQGISVRLAEARDTELRAILLRANPAATGYLPSAALGDKGRGKLVTDPADKDGLRALEPVFLVDVQLPEKALRAGGRAWVRFRHAPRPLAATALWRLRQLFLKVIAGEGQ